jgi:hypothetical protein
MAIRPQAKTEANFDIVMAPFDDAFLGDHLSNGGDAPRAMRFGERASIASDDES